MNSHQVASTSRLHGRMAGESATNSNRATKALRDVLRRLTQARRCGCRGTPDFSNGRITQVRPVDLLEGLKQRSRMSSNSCVCWIHYNVLSYFCSRLVWHSVCFVKGLYEQIIFCFNGFRCFIHYVYVICDYWFNLPNKASQHELLIY
jgi:hypothetical protein